MSKNFNVKSTIAAIATVVAISGASGVALAAPDPVSDISCSNGGQAGALWLQWKVPAGADSYEVRYSTDPISDANYNNAAVYSQSWAAGTQGTYKQELMIGLPINTNYFFAMKARDAASALSTSYSTNNYCSVPSTGSSKMDYTPPTLQVTYPTIGSTIQYGQDLTITGTARDEGGSSVQKIEVAVNGGSWNSATITNSDDSNNVTWKYKLNAGSVSQGEIDIKVRATDWVNNVSGIKTITVTGGDLTTSSTTTTTTTTPTTTTTTVPQTQEELRASLEAQLKALLIKLIELLTAQLNSQLGR